jgi:hypothetical protein
MTGMSDVANDAAKRGKGDQKCWLSTKQAGQYYSELN